MSPKQIIKVRNNSIILFFAQAFSLVLNIFSISLAARYLGVEDFGQFNYYLAIVGVGAKILDFGFNPIIFRELSQKGNEGKYLGSVLIFRISIYLLVIIVIALLGILFNYDYLKLTLILILFINVFFSNKFTNIRELIIIPFKIELKLYIPMFVLILDNLLLLGFVLLMPYVDGGINYFVKIYVFSNIPGMLILFFFVYSKYNFIYKINIDEIKYLLKQSFPLIGFIIFSFLYSVLDVLLLENIINSSSVGIYSSAIRLIVPLKLIPNIFVVTLFPLIVKNIDNKEYSQQITNFVSKIFVIFSILFFAVMLVASKEIITIVFGKEYIAAEMILKILSLGVFFDFFNFFILDLLIAYNNQKYNFRFIVIVIGFMFLGNLILIPYYDFTGAGIARVFSSFVGFIFLLLTLKSQIKIKLKFINFNLLFSGILLFAVIYIFNNLNYLINIFICTIIFLLSLFFMKVFTKKEMQLLVQLAGNNWATKKLKKYYKLGN